MKMSLRTSTTTSKVEKEKEREKETVPTAAKKTAVKDPVCEYAKCCKRFPSMTVIEKDDLKETTWETSVCSETSPVSKITTHELKGKTYNLCLVHGTLVDMYEHVLDKEHKVNELISQTDEGILNPKVDNAPTDAHVKGLRGDFLVAPLSGTEKNQGPEAKKPWSSDLSTEDGDQYHNWSGTWRRAWLARETLNNAQGRQVLNLEDTSFQVVFCTGIPMTSLQLSSQSQVLRLSAKFHEIFCKTTNLASGIVNLCCLPRCIHRLS